MELDPARGYDLIGDIHGCAKTLEHLLATLGYRREAGVWRHPQRMAIFLGDLVDRFKASGQGDAADSWVSDKPNMPLGVDALQAALGHETLTELAQKTGLSQAEVLLRLNVALPDVVNRFTPDGRLPTESEGQARV